MKRIIIILAVLIGLIGISYVGISHRQSVHAQDNGVNPQIIDEVVSNLQKEGIPVEFNKIKTDTNWEPPSIIEFILQSSSNGNRVSPDDPIYFNNVIHEVTMAQKDGLNIGAISVSVINAQGETLCEIIQAANPNISIPEPVRSSNLSADDIAELVEKDSSLHGMQLNDVKVNIKDGLARCILDLQVADIDIANTAIPYFMIDIYNTMAKLNTEKGTQITSYQIAISTTNGEILLKYINDLQFGVKNWWQSEELTKDWFPSPKHVLN